MTQAEIQAILTISLLAAYADSHKHDRERGEIRNIAEGLAGSAELNLPSLYQDVLFKRVDMRSAAARLTSPEAAQLAYEMAVCVCEADGSTSDRELAFLKELRDVLSLDAPFAVQTLHQSEQMAQAPLNGGADVPAVRSDTPAPQPAPTEDDSRQAATSAASASAAGWGHSASQTNPPASPDQALDTLTPPVNTPDEPQLPVNVPQAPQDAARPGTLSSTEIDQKILRAAITNGAIELLPETLSTMAIIPLQMRLVYQIGESYGYSLDKGHIRDFLATVGVGMTSQYLEQAGRKLLGGLLGKKMSKSLFGKIGKQAISSGMSFASTYALGHVANQYYAGGRTLSTQMLRNTYHHILQQGQQLQTRYQPQMEAEARTLDASRIMAMVRGQEA